MFLEWYNQRTLDIRVFMRMEGSTLRTAPASINWLISVVVWPRPAFLFLRVLFFTVFRQVLPFIAEDGANHWIFKGGINVKLNTLTSLEKSDGWAASKISSNAS